jgi:hypothetical protein
MDLNAGSMCIYPECAAGESSLSNPSTSNSSGDSGLTTSKPDLFRMDFQGSQESAHGETGFMNAAYKLATSGAEEKVTVKLTFLEEKELEAVRSVFPQLVSEMSASNEILNDATVVKYLAGSLSDSNDRPSCDPELLEAIQAHRVALHEAAIAADMLGGIVRLKSMLMQKLTDNSTYNSSSISYISNYKDRVWTNLMKTSDREKQLISEAETAMHKLHATKQRLYTALFHHKFKVSS